MKLIKVIFGYGSFLLAFIQFCANINTVSNAITRHFRYYDQLEINISVILYHIHGFTSIFYSVAIGAIVLFATSNWQAVKRHLKRVQIDGDETLLDLQK